MRDWCAPCAYTSNYAELTLARRLEVFRAEKPAGASVLLRAPHIHNSTMRLDDGGGGYSPCFGTIALKAADALLNFQQRPAFLFACNQFFDWSTSLFFFIHGIMLLNFSPTSSIGCSANSRRFAVSVGAPALASKMKLFAYSPV